MKTDLNLSQQQAVEYDKGPLLIIAGAGTGKTTVITSRIKYLVNHKKTNPLDLVALTFTEKAANEMIERLDEIMPYGYEEPWIHTFHGFCDRILRLDGLEIGLSPDYKILTRPKQWILLKKNIFELNLKHYAPLGNPNKFIDELINFFSRLQDEDVSNEEIKAFLATKISPKDKAAYENYQKYEELLKAYEIYNQLKRAENVVDFGDLITLTLKLLRQRPSVLSRYRKQFKHILVDEFQDTNFAQLQLVKVLAPPEDNPNLTVVGDDDQAIYAFRGSSVHNILDFKNHYPNAHEIVLTTNYRSGQPILNAAYASVINNNPDRLETILRIDKQLVSARGKKLPQPAIVAVSSLETEAEFVVTKILELVGKDYTYKDVAILARANAHLDYFVSALKRVGLPYQLIGNRGLFDQDEIRDLLFFLKIVADPADSLSLFYLLHNPVFAIDLSLLPPLLSLSKQKNSFLWDEIKEKGLEDESFAAVVGYIKAAQEKETKVGIAELLAAFIEESGYINQVLKDDSLESQLKVKNINLFFVKIKEFDNQSPNACVAECVDYFDLLIEAGENPAQAEIEDVDTINLLTVHSSKGLEWPIVFLVNAVSDRFPTRNRQEVIPLPDQFIKQRLPQGNEHLQEERRLFYVAITRARDYFFAVWGRDYGGQRDKKPSGFLQELGVEIESWQPQTQKQLSFMFPIKGVPAPLPRKVLDGKINLTHISFSQIKAYKDCPLRYKYEYVLQVPTRTHHSFTFGSTIHSTLQKFHQFEIKGQKPNLETLLHIYDQEFQPLGYDSALHRQKRYEQGKESLKAYFNSYQTVFAGKPIVVEKGFRLKISDLVLIGRIDRIDQLAEGVELIDYKTGNLSNQKKVNKDEQLTLYAMAAETLLGEIPESLSFYYLDAGQKISTTRTKEQIVKMKEELEAVIEKVRQGKFEQTPGFICRYCPYNLICPFVAKN
jgi:DNA helicase II / ATP-dependent DNA helicase PcrA